MNTKNIIAEEKTIKKNQTAKARLRNILLGLPEISLMCNITLDSLFLLRFSLRGATIYQRVFFLAPAGIYSPAKINTKAHNGMLLRPLACMNGI